MSDAPAAPAAPAAPTSAPPPNGAPRNTSGQFSPKDGATGITPPPAAKPGAAPVAPAEPKKPEPWRVKLKLDNEEIELDEERAKRELAELRWRRKQQNEVAAQRKAIEHLIKMAETGGDEAVAKELGIDLDTLAERRMAERQRLAAMSPEQQELERAKAEIAAEAKKLEAEKKRIADETTAAERMKRREASKAEYEAALGHSVLPHSRAKLFLMSQIQRGQTESGAPRFTPEQLGKAYDEMAFSMLDELVRAPGTKPELLARWPDLPKLAVSALDKLDGDALLQALGPALKRKVLEASVAEHRGQQTIPVRRQQQTEAPAAPRQGPIDEVEAEQRKREFLKGF